MAGSSGNSLVPRRVLSGRFLFGDAPTDRESRLEALARYSSARRVAEALRAAEEAGFEGLLTLADARIAGALRLLRAERSALRVLPIIPNVPDYVREATEYGMAGAGLRRLARVGPVGFARAGLAAALRARRVLRKDFTALMRVLYELEMGELRRFAPPAVFLHPQMTDLALSLDNRAFFESYARAVRRGFGAEPGLVTSNLAILAARLAEWDVPIRLVAAPFNRAGFLMAGGLEAYREALAGGRFRLLADRLCPQAPTPRAEIEWALGQPGVAAAAADVRNAEDFGAMGVARTA